MLDGFMPRLLVVGWGLVAAAPGFSQVLPPEPHPMGWASRYGSPAVSLSVAANHWQSQGYPAPGFWCGWKPYGYGLVWRPAHDGGSYSTSWAGPAFVLSPSASPAAPLVVGTLTENVRRVPTEPHAMSAEQLFDLGYSAFWSGNMSAALEHLAAATRKEDDLHAWSYLALAHAILGHSEQARDAARMAAALEFLHPGLSGEALERLPVQWRAVLAQGRRDVPTLSAAKAVLDARTRQEHPDRLKNLRTDRR